MIKQNLLEKLVKYEEALKEKKKKLNLAEALVKDKRAEILERLKKGEKVERGRLIALIERATGRASIRWKEELIKVKGAAYVERLLQKAERPEKDELRIEEAVK